MDTYHNLYGRKIEDKAVVTGKTVACGGSVGRASATGFGAVYCLAEWQKVGGCLWKEPDFPFKASAMWDRMRRLNWKN